MRKTAKISKHGLLKRIKNGSRTIRQKTNQDSSRLNKDTRKYFGVRKPKTYRRNAGAKSLKGGENEDYFKKIINILKTVNVDDDELSITSEDSINIIKFIENILASCKNETETENVVRTLFANKKTLCERFGVNMLRKVSLIKGIWELSKTTDTMNTSSQNISEATIDEISQYLEHQTCASRTTDAIIDEKIFGKKDPIVDMLNTVYSPENLAKQYEKLLSALSSQSSDNEEIQMTKEIVTEMLNDNTAFEEMSNIIKEILKQYYFGNNDSKCSISSDILQLYKFIYTMAQMKTQSDIKCNANPTANNLAVNNNNSSYSLLCKLEKLATKLLTQKMATFIDLNTTKPQQNMVGGSTGKFININSVNSTMPEEQRKYYKILEDYDIMETYKDARTNLQRTEKKLKKYNKIEYFGAFLGLGTTISLLVGSVLLFGLGIATGGIAFGVAAGLGLVWCCLSYSQHDKADNHRNNKKIFENTLNNSKLNQIEIPEKNKNNDTNLNNSNDEFKKYENYYNYCKDYLEKNKLYFEIKDAKTNNLVHKFQIRSDNSLFKWYIYLLQNINNLIKTGKKNKEQNKEKPININDVITAQLYTSGKQKYLYMTLSIPTMDFSPTICYDPINNIDINEISIDISIQSTG